MDLLFPTVSIKAFVSKKVMKVYRNQVVRSPSVGKDDIDQPNPTQKIIGLNVSPKLLKAPGWLS